LVDQGHSGLALEQPDDGCHQANCGDGQTDPIRLGILRLRRNVAYLVCLCCRPAEIDFKVFQTEAATLASLTSPTMMSAAPTITRMVLTDIVRPLGSGTQYSRCGCTARRVQVGPIGLFSTKKQ